MESYSLLREFADSWMLLFLVIFFLGTVVWAFRPGSAATHRDSANVIFRHEDAPAGDVERDKDEDQEVRT